MLKIGDPIAYLPRTLEGSPKIGAVMKGVVHGIQRAYVSGSFRIIGYVVDTGNDKRVDVHRRDLRGEAVGKKVTEIMEADSEKKLDEAVELAQQESGLPKAGITIEKVRQPEQVVVPLADVRPL